MASWPHGKQMKCLAVLVDAVTGVFNCARSQLPAAASVRFCANKQKMLLIDTIR